MKRLDYTEFSSENILLNISTSANKSNQSMHNVLLTYTISFSTRTSYKYEATVLVKLIFKQIKNYPIFG